MSEFGYEILTDFSRSGRERPWQSHKINSILLSESYTRLKMHNKSERVCNCGSHLRFNVCPSGHEKRLSWSNFCRVRMCPMCSWRRSLLVAHQIKLVAHGAITGEDAKGNKLSIEPQKMRWLFLTLTIRNCEPDDLDETINQMMAAWKIFIKRKELRKTVIGWFRGFEVTRNQNDGTFHPHFHVLLGVPPSYFKGEDYMKTSDLALIWQECLKVDYVPIVDLRIVKNKRNPEKEVQLLEQKGIEISSDGRMVEADLSGSAVAEMAKYATKSEDYLIYNKYTYKNVDRKGKMKAVPDLKSGIDEQKTDETVLFLDKALSRRRLIAFGGLLKEVWEELQMVTASICTSLFVGIIWPR